MRLVEGKKFSDFVVVVPDDDNDLWYLSNIIVRGDSVGSVVFRREERKEDMIRAKETDRKPVHIIIVTEKLEFMSFTDKLKVLGVVTEGPEDLMNEHQSINIAPGDRIEIRDKRWDQASRHMLNESLERVDRGTVFVALDDESSSIFQLRTYGINVIAKLYSGKSGKMFESKFDEKGYFEEIAGALPRTGINTLVILGPGMTRNRLREYLSGRNLPFSIESFPSDRTDEGSVYAFLQSDEAERIVSQSRLAIEQKLLESFLKEVSRSGSAAYGFDTVKDLLSRSAVDKVLITEDEFRTDRGREILDLAEQTGAEPFIFSTRDDPGIVLGKFGRFAALLRYRVDY